MPKAPTKKKGGSRGVRVNAPVYHPTESGLHALTSRKEKKLGMKELKEERAKVGPRYQELTSGTYLGLLVASKDQEASAHCHVHRCGIGRQAGTSGLPK